MPEAYAHVFMFSSKNIKITYRTLASFIRDGFNKLKFLLMYKNLKRKIGDSAWKGHSFINVVKQNPPL